MSTPTGRDNGLPPATRYVALVDVDPPVADHVLEILRDAGVTAVAEPLAGERGPARETPPPRRPTERVHVDLRSLGLARDVVGQALPSLRADFHADAARRADAEEAARDRRRREELDADQVESLFADIIAGYADVTDEPVPRWPVTEDVDDPDDDLDAPGQSETPQRPPLSSRLVRSRRTDDPVPVEDPEEHFIPPEPPPLPEADRVTRLAWAALLGGPALIVLAALLNIPLEGWVVVLALVSFLGGFATLVARMRDRDDDGWDDGAVL